MGLRPPLRKDLPLVARMRSHKSHARPGQKQAKDRCSLCDETRTPGDSNEEKRKAFHACDTCRHLVTRCASGEDLGPAFDVDVSYLEYDEALMTRARLIGQRLMCLSWWQSVDQALVELVGHWRTWEELREQVGQFLRRDFIAPVVGQADVWACEAERLVNRDPRWRAVADLGFRGSLSSLEAYLAAALEVHPSSSFAICDPKHVSPAGKNCHVTDTSEA